MSLHSYTRLWVHLIWATRSRQRVLNKQARKLLSGYLYRYAQEKDIYMKINYVNPEHVHVLFDMPATYSTDKVAQLFKGSSSKWLNDQQVLPGKFNWGRGYGAFSVSHSKVDEVARYIANQEEHHKRVGFQDEIRKFVQVYGLVWHDED